MKRIICGLSVVLLCVAALGSCGSEKCNMCGKSCSKKYSYRDGEVTLCGSCYKDCFKEKTEVDAEEYFAVEAPAEETAE